MKTYLITGGAGFIGSNFILHLLSKGAATIINYDKLTYAGNLESLESVSGNSNYIFVKGDICDREPIQKLLVVHDIDTIVNFAAESHVDRSIDSPGDFINTNIVGAFELLECARWYWRGLKGDKQRLFRFLQVSTDEVYGALGDAGSFTEETPYAPNSPYSASKASADHLARSYHKTYGFPVITTNCSNNYGPRQFPEKLIPLMIHNALAGKPLPVYGDGLHIRDWLYVKDHCLALQTVIDSGKTGDIYTIGGNNEKTNLDLVETLSGILDERVPDSPYCPHNSLIHHVEDRPGHDRRYSIDCSKIQNELGWSPKETPDTGLRKTVQWYLDNQVWVQRVMSGDYRGERLGLGVGIRGRK